MTNINKKNFSSMLQPSLAAKGDYNQRLPFFKNPNSNWQSQPQAVSANLLPLEDSLALPLKAGGPLLAGAGLQRQLVFLQKKGSQTPNPNIISYNFQPVAGFKPKINTVYNINKLMTNNVYKLLFNFFKSMYCLISKPVFITTPDKIKIQLFYFVCIPKFLIASGYQTVTGFAEQPKGRNYLASVLAKPVALGRDSRLDANKDLNVKINLKNLAQSNLTKVYPQKFKLICTILSKFFNKRVELELIRLHQPYYDSNILVNFLALIINKKNIGACIQRLYNSNIIKSNKASSLSDLSPMASLENIYNPSSVDFAKGNKSSNSTTAYLSGLNIKISGRLMREPIIPRITSKKFEKGFTAKGKINYSDLARFTHKNRKGAFTITVKSGQNF